MRIDLKVALLALLPFVAPRIGTGPLVFALFVVAEEIAEGSPFSSKRGLMKSKLGCSSINLYFVYQQFTFPRLVTFFSPHPLQVCSGFDLYLSLCQRQKHDGQMNSPMSSV
jgi:hypothetical protein